MLITGLDQFVAAPTVDGPLGLLTNVASLSADGRTALRALQAAKVDIVTVLAPEHGYYGIGNPAEPIPHDTLGMLPVYSLYESANAPIDKTNLENVLRTLKGVIVDLQDVGLRWYTFVAVLVKILRECEECGIPVIILDRPNPLGGYILEGPCAESKLFSLVAAVSMPIRYGLTLGELARWYVHEHGLNVQLTVVPMRGWKRSMLYDETGLAWISPSPNIAHPQTTIVYAGTCLIEALNVSEGRGTALPFEQIGAPFIDAEKLAEAMNVLTLPGFTFRPAWFRPLTSKYAGERCQGVRIIVTNPHETRGFSMGLHLLETLWRLYPTHVYWIGEQPTRWIDKLTGTDRVRRSLDAGQSVTELLESFTPSIATFQAKTKAFYLYD